MADCQVQWSAVWLIGDPTCLWYIDCSQGTTSTYEPEYTPWDEFYIAHSNWYNWQEWQWIRDENDRDPTFIDLYRNWAEIEAGSDKFTSFKLREWARRKGLYDGVDEVRGNRRAGKRFEDAALKYMGMESNGRGYPVNSRRAQNPSYPSTVIPDAKFAFLDETASPR